MNTPLTFTIQNLLTEDKDKISGPMSPLLFAQEVAKQMEFKFNRLARVWFSDEEVHQGYEHDGLTGHDTLIIGSQYKNDLWLSLWVDTGVGGVAVAMAYRSDSNIAVTPIYEKRAYARKLTVPEIQQIFEYVFSHPQEIEIPKKS